MESFEGFHIYTTNQTTWVEILNASTAEFTIGHLPPGVVAIQGLLNDTIRVPAGTNYIIEKAGRAEFGDRDIEKVIFGALSGLVVAVAIAWLAYHIKEGILLSPRGSSSHPMEADDMANGSHEMRNGNDRSFVSFDDFKAKLDVYYEVEVTELELYQRTLKADGVSVGDVEAALELLRKMYDKDIAMWATQNSQEDGAENQRRLKAERDAMMADLRATVKKWDDPVTSGLAGWGPEEEAVVKELKEMLDGLQK